MNRKYRGLGSLFMVLLLLISAESAGENKEPERNKYRERIYETSGCEITREFHVASDSHHVNDFREKGVHRILRCKDGRDLFLDGHDKIVTP
jgi:hypothetical protein